MKIHDYIDELFYSKEENSLENNHRKYANMTSAYCIKQTKNELTFRSYHGYSVFLTNIYKNKIIKK